jgi:hypothetical protein
MSIRLSNAVLLAQRAANAAAMIVEVMATPAAPAKRKPAKKRAKKSAAK